MEIAVDKSILGWLCDPRIKTEDPHQVKLALQLYWRVEICLIGVGGGFQMGWNVLGQGVRAIGRMGCLCRLRS